jgi:tetracycline repressor-like protein
MPSSDATDTAYETASAVIAPAAPNAPTSPPPSPGPASCANACVGAQLAVARRWTSRHDLVKATIAHAAATRPISTPDTGSLRGDLIAYMRELNAARLDLATMLGVQLGGYYQETGETLSDLRDVVLGGQDPVAHTIFAAAIERGEADPGRLTPRIRSLPVDLLSNEVLKTLQPMPDEGIDEIVDTIILPLVRPY